MLIVALVLAVIGLSALVTAVVTSNEVVAWVCIAASSIGVILLVVDAIRERQQRRAGYLSAGSAETTEFIEYTDDAEDDDGAQGGVASEAAEDIADSGDDRTEVISADDDADAELTREIAEEAHPDEIVHDEPDFDTYSDDEPDYPPPAEEAALHTEAESDESTQSPPDGSSADER